MYQVKWKLAVINTTVSCGIMYGESETNTIQHSKYHNKSIEKVSLEILRISIKLYVNLTERLIKKRRLWRYLKWHHVR